MFTEIKSAVATLTVQAALTRKALEAMPDARWTWRPHDKSRTAGELAWHIATGLHWFVADALKLQVAPKPATPPPTTAALLETFDAMTRGSLDALAKKDDAWLRTETDFFGTKLTNGGILGTQLTHEAHHRGQLTIYIRLTGGRVPAVAGPTADDR